LLRRTTMRFCTSCSNLDEGLSPADSFGQRNSPYV